MLDEQALKTIRKRKGRDPFLERFLSNLFLLFDRHLPPSIESEVNALLRLLAQ